MKTRWILCVPLLLLALPAQAEIYKWKDAKGNTVISDTPRPGANETVIHTPAASTTTTAPKPGKSLADQELEAKKRRQERQQAEAKAAEEAEMAKRKQDSCERMRQNRAALASGQRIRRPNDKGEGVYLTDEQRQQELAAVDETLARDCATP